MIYKEEILNFGSADFEVQVAYIFKKALKDIKITGQSLESVIYEILEAIEESQKEEDDLIKSLKIIKEILLEESKSSINSSYKKFITAKRVCKESINKEYALIEEFVDVIQDYAKVNRHKKLLLEFSKKEILLNDLEQNIRYNIFKNRKAHA
jgi:hypothetical protein